MPAAIPTVVRRGNTSGYYYWDGVHAMTPLANGWGGILATDFDMPTVTLTTSAFDVMQAELQGRDIAFADGVAVQVAQELTNNDDYLQAVADAVNGP